jgi:hypothetical protein
VLQCILHDETFSIMTFTFVQLGIINVLITF